MKKVIITVAILFHLLGAYSQKTWTLTKCIHHAVDNNIELNRAYNLVANQEINHLESKANVLPSLNFLALLYKFHLAIQT